MPVVVPPLFVSYSRVETSVGIQLPRVKHVPPHSNGCAPLSAHRCHCIAPAAALTASVSLSALLAKLCNMSYSSPLSIYLCSL